MIHYILCQKLSSDQIRHELKHMVKVSEYIIYSITLPHTRTLFELEVCMQHIHALSYMLLNIPLELYKC